MRFARAAVLACVSVLLSPLAVGQVTVAPFLNPHTQFFCGGNSPCASGKLYTCVAGSTCPGTPQTAYTDATGSTALPNPVILDGSGSASIWLSSAKYKIVLQNSGGVQQYTADNVTWATPPSTFTSITTANFNNILWVGTGAGQYSSISACLAALPNSVYTSCSDSIGMCWVSGGGECHTTPGWSETLAANLVMANDKQIVMHCPTHVTMGAFSVTAAGGTYGWSITGVPHLNHNFEQSGCDFDGYTGSGDEFQIGSGAGTLEGVKITDVQIHAADGGNAANALHIISCQDCIFKDLDLTCSHGASNSGSGMLVEGGLDGTSQSRFDDVTINFCNNPVTIQDGTGGSSVVGNIFNNVDIGNPQGTAGPGIAVKGASSYNEFHLLSNHCCGSTFTNFINFGGTANGNHVWSNNGGGFGASISGSTVVFGASTGNNTYTCIGGSCTSTNSGAATNQVIDAATSGALVQASATQTLTNKTLDTAGPNTLKVNGNTLSATAGTATVTIPNSTDTLVGRATTDTLTNKTLTAPVISTISNTGTLTLPTSTDTLTGRATTDTLTNKTLTGASSGNAVSLLNQQAAAAHITGTSSAATVYTYTIPANTIGSGKGFRAKACWLHDTGSASVTYAFTVGASSVFSNSHANQNNTAIECLTLEMFNNSGVQNAQNFIVDGVIQYSNSCAISGGGTNPDCPLNPTVSTSAVDFTSSQAVAFTFNVANTDKVTPEFWRVELVQ